MPLITLTGVPCVGKSTFACFLKEYLEAKGLSVVVIAEDASLSKTNLYGSSAQEKVTRATIKSAVGRAMSTDTVVIVDSLNYIKGYRYELYCIAREQRTSSCCVWVTLSDANAEQLHSERGVGASETEGAHQQYPDHIFHDLRQRFEVPVEKNRWEAPLFEVDMTSAVVSSSSEAEVPDAALQAHGSGSVFTMTTTPQSAAAGDAHEPGAEADNTTEKLDVAPVRVALPPQKSSFRRFKKKTVGGSAPSVPTVTPDTSATHDAEDAAELTPVTNGDSSASQDGPIRQPLWFSGSTVVRDAVRGMSPSDTSAAIHAYLTDSTKVQASAATVRLPHADAEMVYALDSVSQQIVGRIDVHQREQVEGTPVIFSEFDRSLTLNRRVSLQELQRHRRQFVRVNTLYAPRGKGAIGSAFIDFVANNV